MFDKTKQNEFEILETKSSIKGFTTQYTINGIEGADAESFLAAARPQVVSLLGGKRGTKVSLVLAYTMQRM